MTDPRTALEQKARAWIDDSSGEVKSWAEVFMECGMPGATFDIFVSQLTDLLLSTQAEALEEAIKDLRDRLDSAPLCKTAGELMPVVTAHQGWCKQQAKERRP